MPQRQTCIHTRTYTAIIVFAITTVRSRGDIVSSILNIGDSFHHILEILKKSMLSYISILGRRVDIQVKDNRDGTFSCQYLPKKPIKHTIIISYGGVNTPKSPYRVS